MKVKCPDNFPGPKNPIAGFPEAGRVYDAVYHSRDSFYVGSNSDYFCLLEDCAFLEAPDGTQYQWEVVTEDKKAPEATHYFIWSTERNMWWNPNEVGYTENITEAGKYSSQKAIDIVMKAMVGWNGKGLPPEVLVPCEFG